MKVRVTNKESCFYGDVGKVILENLKSVVLKFDFDPGNYAFGKHEVEGPTRPIWYMSYSPGGREYGPFDAFEKQEIQGTARVRLYWRFELGKEA